MLLFPALDSLKKELDLQDGILDIKLIKKAHDKRECEEFEMVLRHKSKLQVYRELQWEIGFEEYLEYVRGTPSKLHDFNVVFRNSWAL